MWWVSLILLSSTLSSILDPPPSYNTVGLTGVLNWTNSRLEWAENNFLSTHTRYTYSPLFWQDHTIYSIVVDRFNNGNLTNDNYNLPQAQKQNQNTANLYDLPQWRHGGDLKGITDRLQYIADLGLNTLWITPILQMDGSYHGYCTTFPTDIDPGYGTLDDLRSLVDTAHSLDIYIILDIVVNHLCDANSTDVQYSTSPNHESCCTDKYNYYVNGNDWSTQSPNEGTLQFSNAWFPPLDVKEFYSECGANSWEDTSGESPCAIYGDFTASMIDYDTRNRNFQQIFTELHKFWIAAADIDGFRLDAAKHITSDFIEYFSTNIREYALSLGKDNFFIVGEIAASAYWQASSLGNMMSNPSNPDQHDANLPALITQQMWLLKDMYLQHPYQPYPGLTSVYDFYFSGVSKSVLLSEKAPSDIEAYFSTNDYNYIAGQNNYQFSWTLVEIHDWPRFINNIPTSWSVSIMAAAYLLTSQGMPIIYYGFEQGFNGICNENNIQNVGNAYQDIVNVCNGGDDDSLKRQDMFLYSPWKLGSAIDSINSLSYIGSYTHQLSPPINEDPFLNTTHLLYKHIQKLLHLRKACVALRRGNIQFRWVDNAIGGWLIYSRIYSADNIEMLIAINTDHNTYKDMPQQITIDYQINMNMTGGKYLNILSPNTSYGWIGIDNTNNAAHLYINNPIISIPSSGYAIFIREDQIGAYDQKYDIALCLDAPTKNPTTNPTQYPSKQPTKSPSANPTETPITNNPSLPPTKTPTATPVVIQQSNDPSKSPTYNPTLMPTKTPVAVTESNNPTKTPTFVPTKKPSYNPTGTALECDECTNISSDDDGIFIRVVFWFPEWITYDFTNIECWLYMILKKWLNKFDGFEVCDITVFVRGGVMSSSDNKCSYVPCLYDNTNNQIRRILLNDRNANVSMVFISEDDDFNDLPLNEMKNGFVIEFSNDFNVNMDVEMSVLIEEDKRVNDQQNDNTIIIIVIVICVLVFIVLLIIFIVCYRKRKLNKNDDIERKSMISSQEVKVKGNVNVNAEHENDKTGDKEALFDEL